MHAPTPSPSLTVSDDGQQFTLSLPGGPARSYSNDKAGKRQAILDGLQALPTVTVDGQTYLPSAPALELVALVIYPEGIASEAAYQKVCAATSKACALIGYSDQEVQLGPPHVPFPARGLYRPQYPDVNPADVLAELAHAPADYQAPRQETYGQVIWNKLAWQIYGKAWSAILAEQQQRIRRQVEAIAAAAGWQSEPEGPDNVTYRRPLPVDLGRARRELARLLADVEGAPVSVSSLTDAAQRGAYGRFYPTAALDPQLDDLISELLAEHGYQTEADEGDCYQPQPLLLVENGLRLFAARLAELTPTQTEQGACLWLDQLAELVRELLPAGAAPVGDGQIKRFLTYQAGQLLRQAGYRTELEWLRPPDAAGGRANGQWREGIRRQLNVQQEAEKTVQFVPGMAVRVPALAVDDKQEEIVYLEMVGPKGAVRANWAALAGKKANWVGAQRLYLDGMKNHIRLDGRLPCGWHQLALIHRQASLQEANPDEPFYLLDDGRQAIPPLFYPLLNRCLALPLLPAWADYLWQQGREARLILLLNRGQGQRYAAWRVLPSPDKWPAIVKAGLAGGALSLGA
jgi:hypothetical protein